ncbi:MAG TPA: thermonuclease family protein [Pyrinomonadaceae bacterium]
MKILRRATLLALLLAVCLPVCARAVDFVEGEVVAIADGDTLTVLDRDKRQHRIRLLGIDAPERGQDFGERSRQSLADMVFNKQVHVIVLKLDRYGRKLGKVTLSRTDVNLEQLRAGMAWYYRHYESDVFKEDRVAYDRAEREAKAAKRGLWADPRPIPPWEFRRTERTRREVPDETTARPARQSPPGETAGADVRLGPIVGNRRSMIYHWPGCPNYNSVSPANRVIFPTREAAERAGYRAARNCR